MSGVGIDVRHGGSGGGGGGAPTGAAGGDLAGTYPNPTIGTNKVVTAKILDANVTNAKLADVATATFKGRTTAGTGVPEDLTVTQATAMLNVFGPDSGAGGVKGLTPATGAGDAAAGKFLKADGTWAVPAGTVLNSFTTIQPDAGTAPVADSATDTLTLTSTDLTITGNSGTDTVTFAIANDKVVTAKILDANVTNAKLANMAQSTIKGRAAAAGTGVPTDLTPTQVLTMLAQPESISTSINGNGGVITTGIVPGADWRAPFGMTITGWYLMSDVSGSIVIDIWKDTFANFAPTVADTITAAAKPTLSSAQTNSNTSLGTWTTTVAAGDVLRFNVDSVSTITYAVLTLVGVRT